MILVGTSGWSHGSWVGPFYPVALRDSPDAWLAHYATRFRTVEITSTFDALPDEDLVASWARSGIELQAPQGPFEFSLKMPRAVTHEALVKEDVDRAWAIAARFERVVLEPLADEGLLGAVLVQLPPGLAPTRGIVRTLREILLALDGRAIALEPRDPSWTKGGQVAPEARPLFEDAEVALVESDAPGAAPADAPDARHAYFRFHGRRADLWSLPREHADEGARYDYLYATHELAPWASRAARHEAAERVVRAYFNNAPSAKGVANAVEFRHLLGEAEGIARPRLTEQTRLRL